MQRTEGLHGGVGYEWTNSGNYPSQSSTEQKVRDMTLDDFEGKVDDEIVDILLKPLYNQSSTLVEFDWSRALISVPFTGDIQELFSRGTLDYGAYEDTDPANPTLLSISLRGTGKSGPELASSLAMIEAAALTQKQQMEGFILSQKSHFKALVAQQRERLTTK